EPSPSAPESMARRAEQAERDAAPTERTAEAAEREEDRPEASRERREASPEPIERQTDEKWRAPAGRKPAKSRDFSRQPRRERKKNRSDEQKIGNGPQPRSDEPAKHGRGM